jgi:hypothetical protein
LVSSDCYWFKTHVNKTLFETSEIDTFWDKYILGQVETLERNYYLTRKYFTNWGFFFLFLDRFHRQNFKTIDFVFIFDAVHPISDRVGTRKLSEKDVRTCPDQHCIEHINWKQGRIVFQVHYSAWDCRSADLGIGRAEYRLNNPSSCRTRHHSSR